MELREEEKKAAKELLDGAAPFWENYTGALYGTESRKIVEFIHCGQALLAALAEAERERDAYKAAEAATSRELTIAAGKWEQAEEENGRLRAAARLVLADAEFVVQEFDRAGAVSVVALNELQRVLGGQQMAGRYLTPSELAQVREAGTALLREAKWAARHVSPSNAFAGGGDDPGPLVVAIAEFERTLSLVGGGEEKR